MSQIIAKYTNGPKMILQIVGVGPIGAMRQHIGKHLAQLTECECQSEDGLSYIL
jgi:hypothetical protein